MSLLYHTYQKADLQDRDYGFILALVCMALAIVVARRYFSIGRCAKSHYSTIGTSIWIGLIHGR